MDYNVIEAIRGRRSVRTYSEEPLTAQDRKKLEDCIAALENPFGVSVEFRFLDAEQYGLNSPVIVGEDTYLGAKIKNTQNYEIAFGYDFERVVLYAQSLGIGTVWIAGTMNRAAFEHAMEVGDGEVMPAVTPIGYPAKKMSLRETMMRKGVKADDRLPFDTLFFKNSFSEPLAPADAGVFADALEMVRLAPSAVNKQPWRAVVCGDTVHFYEKKSGGMSERAFDVQKVDIGIALCHLVLTLEQSGISGKFIFADPKLGQDDGTDYIVSFTTEK